MVGCKDLVHAQRGRESNEHEQPRKFRQFIHIVARTIIAGLYDIIQQDMLVYII